MSVEKLQKIIELLNVYGKQSPTSIGKKTHTDIRTLKKIMRVAVKLGLVGYIRFKAPKRTYTLYVLTPEYIAFMKNICPFSENM